MGIFSVALDSMMKTCIFLVGIISLSNLCHGTSISGMEFSFIEKQSNNLLPSISVKFPDGYTDRLILWKHYFNEEDRMKNEHTDDCHYFGHLAKEKEACVAVTGCMG